MKTEATTISRSLLGQLFGEITKLHSVRLPFKVCMLAAMMLGFLLGALSSVSASPKNSWAGYEVRIANKGVRGNIGWANPGVVNLSAEWVMSWSPNPYHYIQAGWIKFSTTPTPQHYVEWTSGVVSSNCGNGFCRFYFGTVQVGTTHTYQVDYNAPSGYAPYWCTRIDYNCVKSPSATEVGLTGAPEMEISGEAHDTNDDIGGTITNQLHIDQLNYWDQSNVLRQLPQSSLLNITAGPPYYANNGSSGGNTYINNYTLR